MTNQTDLLYIGIDLDGHYIKSVLCDSVGQILSQRRQAISTNDQDEIISLLISSIKQLQNLGMSDGNIVGVGIGITGLVDSNTNQIEMWSGLSIASVEIYNKILETTQLPTVFDNHSNVAAYGEWQCGAARGFNHILYVDVGSTISASMILNGQMWRGSTGLAGEIGCNTLDLDAEKTLYNVVSSDNIVRRVQERLYRDRTSSLSRLSIPNDREMILDDIIKSAAAGDELARVVVERTGLYLGIGLSGIINLLNPELVVVGGSDALGDILLLPMVAEIERRAFAPIFKNCRIVVSQLGSNAGMIGAAMLARDSLINSL